MVRIETGRWWIAAAVLLPSWLARVVGEPAACLGLGMRGGEDVAQGTARALALELLDVADTDDVADDARVVIDDDGYPYLTEDDDDGDRS